MATSNAFKSGDTKSISDFLLTLMVKASTPTRMVSTSLSLPEVMKNPKGMTPVEVQDIIQMAVATGRVVVRNPVPVSQLIVKPRSAKAEFITSQHQTAILDKDSSVVAALQTMSKDVVDDAQYLTYLRGLQECVSTFHATKGSLQGLLTRWNRYIQGDVALFLGGPTASKAEVADRVNTEMSALLDAKIILLKPDPLAFAVDTFSMSPDTQINYQSSAGAAYLDTPKDDPLVFELALGVAHKIFAMCVANFKVGNQKDPKRAKFSTWFAQVLHDHPGWFLTELRPKLEVYEKSLLMTKARPYYVYPYHFCLMAAEVFQRLKKCWVSYQQDNETSSALGFVWAHGGATTLMQKVQGLKPGQSMFISYADDQLMAFNLHGRVFVATPDVDQMDSRVNRNYGVLMMDLLKKAFPNATLAWTNLFQLLVTLPFQTLLLIVRNYTVFKMDKLSTGVWGTSEFDQLVSSSMGLRFKTAYAAYSKKHLTPKGPERAKESAEEFLGLFAESMKDAGVMYKPETLGVTEVASSYDEPKFLQVSFLGFKLVVVGTNATGNLWFPYKEPKEIIKCAVFPRQHSSLPGPMLTMARLYGVAYNGLALFPGLYFALKARFDLFNGMSTQDAKGEDVTFRLDPKLVSVEKGVFEEGDPVAEWENTMQAFPTREYLFAFFLPPRVATQKMFKPFDSLVTSEPFNIPSRLPSAPAKTKKSWYEQMEEEVGEKPLDPSSLDFYTRLFSKERFSKKKLETGETVKSAPKDKKEPLPKKVAKPKKKPVERSEKKKRSVGKSAKGEVRVMDLVNFDEDVTSNPSNDPDEGGDESEYDVYDDDEGTFRGTRRYENPTEDSEPEEIPLEDSRQKRDALMDSIFLKPIHFDPNTGEIHDPDQGWTKRGRKWRRKAPSMENPDGTPEGDDVTE